MRELSRRAGISHTQIADVVNSRANPGADFCIAVARALGEQPEKMLRLAGILPPLPPAVEEENEILQIVRHLSPVQRQAALAILRSLSSVKF